MKTLILITLLISSTLFAADKTVKQETAEGGVLINKSLQKLMDIPGVKAIYAGCTSNNTSVLTPDANVRMQKNLTCLWEGVQKNEELKKKVMTAYTDEAKSTGEGAGRSPASDPSKVDIVTRKTNVSLDYEKDPGVIALNKYYGDKLDEILDPDKALTTEENKKNTILEIDHRKFIELYKSELGKTIISAFTSYCLDTKPSTCTSEVKSCVIDEKTMKDDRATNIKSLASINLQGDSEDAKKWKSCIVSVPKHCADAKASDNTFNQTETVKRSCLIMDYVASARKNIILADEQTKFYDDLKKDRAYGLVSNTKEVDAKKSSSDALLEISSKDVENNMQDPMKQAQADMDACYKNNAIANPEACKKFLSTSKEENEMAIAELGMRQIAQQDVLQKELNSSPERVKDYLKQEGYTDGDIKSMTANAATIEQTKAEIMERYKNEKEAIVAEMAARINAKTSSTEGKINPQADLSKIEAISKEMNSRKEDLSNLVKFNNIVSSYLEISTVGSKEVGRNTASLFGEVKDMDADQAKILNEQIKQAKLSPPKTDGNGSSATNLDVDTINQKFLNYKTLPTTDDSKK